MQEEDAPEMLRSAQERMGKKLKAELSAASAGAATAVATEAEQMVPSLGILEEDASSVPPTSRSALSKSKVREALILCQRLVLNSSN